MESKDNKITIENSVVLIKSDHMIINYLSPWSIKNQITSTSTGFCIEYKGKKYIITNAHCILNAIHITMRKRGTSKIFHAHPVWIVCECDLALLDIDEKLFWKGMEPLTIIEGLNKLDKVYVYGYPHGGYNISITKGVVSRIGIIPYFNVANNIVIQIDAAVNNGNSGGPVLNRNNQVVGIVFSGENESENMGYIIPGVIVNYFLNAMTNNNRDGKFIGICGLGLTTQRMYNDTTKEYYGLPKEKTGIIVREVIKAGSAIGYIHSNDIILEINNNIIYNDGTIVLSDMFGDGKGLYDEEIVPFSTYVSLCNPNDKLAVKIWRNNKEKIIHIPVKPIVYAVPKLEYHTPLSYVIIMGMLFIPLSYALIQAKDYEGEDITRLEEANNLAVMNKAGPEDQVIVLSEIFTVKQTEGYRSNNFILQALNGIEIKNIKHLVRVIESQLKKQFIEFSFYDEPWKFVLKCSDIKKYDTKIRKEYFGNIDPYQI